MRNDSPSSKEPRRRRVAVTGGGVAGIAASLRLAELGCEVELFERRRHLGGRARSFVHSQGEGWIDTCCHLALGCCREFLDFAHRCGILPLFSHETRIPFVVPGGRAFTLRQWPWLPAPFHLLPAFAGLGFLTIRERLALAVSLRRLVRGEGDTGETIAAWLERHAVPRHAVERFYFPVLVSAAGDTLDRIPLPLARQLMREAFFEQPGGHNLLLPRCSLTELFDVHAGRALTRRGVVIRRNTPVEKIELVNGATSRGRFRLAIGSDAPPADYDAVVPAVPPHAVGKLLSEPLKQRLALPTDGDLWPYGWIAAVHLWFDRPCFALPHAALLDAPAQWVFRPAFLRSGSVDSRRATRENAAADTSRPGWYVQAVISAAQRLVPPMRTRLLDEVTAQLRRCFPRCRDAEVVASRVVIEKQAILLPCAEVERRRPAQLTAVHGLALAGDWTTTGWPSTMEGAVRSGHTAAELVIQTLSTDRPVAPPAARVLD